ncbi:ThiF family adenylyltransferase [Nocardioides rubriscoriae]|uniref:ThiF family adenylyltransferase n=1 Tax=Nocardioides rubriscoriae TaxID=642762 RepID=UPI0011E05244|nr:ThiF family adenylyltransferase [Nocardioides rubriscoriae]
MILRLATTASAVSGRVREGWHFISGRIRENPASLRAEPSGAGEAGAAPGAELSRTFSVAMTTTVESTLIEHLTRLDGQEDLTFALYQPSTGLSRDSALLVDVVLPDGDERHVHGNVAFTGDYFLRAAAQAAESDLGLAFLHSHPRAKTWQGMSKDDYAAEHGHASQTQIMTGLPLVGLTLGTGNATFSARRWTRPNAQPHTHPDSRADGQAGGGAGDDYQPQSAHSVRVVGERIRVHHNPTLSPPPARTLRLLRTVQAWGQPAQDDLARLRVGVVGAGSVGQLVAESLARTGIVNVDVIDFDTVSEHNLDRLVHAGSDDVGRSKTASLIEGLARSAVAPGASMTGTEYSVVEAQGWAHALDCDVLFSCVDRPWPRYALNVAALAHLVPVIDGGVAVDVSTNSETDSVTLLGAEWRAHLVAPGRRCLECLGQYDPGDVTLEQSGLLDDSTYVEALPHDHHLRRGENVFAFSMACAAAEVLELLRAVLAPSGLPDVGATLTHWATATTDCDVDACKPTCYISAHLIGSGDAAPLTVTGPHPIAERARAERAGRAGRAGRDALALSTSGAVSPSRRARSALLRRLRQFLHH